ncbi:MAG: hypothetical protein Kapaf2KO_06780 [Candidatus Kapaibacteriales bacterium]
MKKLIKLLPVFLFLSIFNISNGEGEKKDQPLLKTASMTQGDKTGTAKSTFQYEYEDGLLVSAKRIIEITGNRGGKPMTITKDYSDFKYLDSKVQSFSITDSLKSVNHKINFIYSPNTITIQENKEDGKTRIREFIISFDESERLTELRNATYGGGQIMYERVAKFDYPEENIIQVTRGENLDIIQYLEIDKKIKNPFKIEQLLDFDMIDWSFIHWVYGEGVPVKHAKKKNFIETGEHEVEIRYTATPNGYTTLTETKTAAPNSEWSEFFRFEFE